MHALIHAPAPRVSVLVRGWLHGNVVLLQGDDGATLVDTGYHTGVDDLRAFLNEVASGVPVRDVALTHVHSDHAGGVAALRGWARGAAAPLLVYASEAAARLVAAWDEPGLWLGPSGQEMPVFEVDQPLVPGVPVPLAGGVLVPIATPGHMRCAVSLYAPDAGLVITGDALWENGFGLLDPWAEGEDCLDRAADALARLAELPEHTLVIPGHGRPFCGLHPAIERAERRLRTFREEPESLRRNIAVNGLGFLALARPELGFPGLIAQAVRLVEAHPSTDPAAPSAEALVNEAFERMMARLAGS